MFPLFLNQYPGARGRAMRGFALLAVLAFAWLTCFPSPVFAAPTAGGARVGSAVPLQPHQLEPADKSYVHPPVVTFRWTPTEGANWYYLHIFRDDQMDNEMRITVPGSETTYSIDGLEPDHTYIWSVGADVVTGGYNYDYWEFTLANQVLVPLPLEQIRASDGLYNDQVEVTWFQSYRTSYYLLQRRAPGSASFVDLAVVGSERTYSDKEPAPEIHYQYRVLACNSAGCSAPSPADEGWIGACNPAPVPVLVSPAEGAEIRFTQQDPWYYLRWQPIPNVPGFWVHVWDVATGHTVANHFVDWQGADTFELSGEAGHLAWNVTAANPVIGCPRGQPSETRTFTAILNPPPPVPVNVRASDGQYPDKVVIAWDQPPSDYSVEAFEIWRSTQPDVKTAQRLKELFATGPYEDTTVTPGTLYYYWITSCSHADGCSAKSQPDTGYAGAPPVEVGFSYFLPMVEK